MAKAKTVIPYFGGKANFAWEIMSLMPKHRVYVEVFGGSAAILMNKSRSELEVYNDIDSDLVNFFRVLRDPEKAALLKSELELSPFSREEYLWCMEKLKSGVFEDEIDRARVWYVLARQGFSGNVGKGGWRVHKNSDPTDAYWNSIQLLPEFTRRLMHVVIENADWFKIIKEYDGPDVLFYVDPPYKTETRRGGKYRNEVGVSDHIKLMGAIHNCKGMVLLSGYDNTLYNDYLPGWSRHTIETKSTAGNGNKGQTIRERTEVVWIKPNTVMSKSLWTMDDLPQKVSAST